MNVLNVASSQIKCFLAKWDTRHMHKFQKIKDKEIGFYQIIL